MNDQDPGDENHHDFIRPWWMDTIFIRGGCWVGMHSSMIYIWPPNEDHDGGDEDDYHNYIPSVHPKLGLRLWSPRDEGL